MALKFNAVNRSLRCLLYWSSSATELVLHCCHLFFLPTLACDHYITFSSLQLVNCYATAAWISFSQYCSAGIRTHQTSILWMFGHYLVFVLVWSWFCQSILAPYWCKTRQEVFEIANAVLCTSQICKPTILANIQAHFIPELHHFPSCRWLPCVE